MTTTRTAIPGTTFTPVPSPIPRPRRPRHDAGAVTALPRLMAGGGAEGGGAGREQHQRGGRDGGQGAQVLAGAAAGVHELLPGGDDVGGRVDVRDGLQPAGQVGAGEERR